MAQSLFKGRKGIEATCHFPAHCEVIVSFEGFAVSQSGIRHAMDI